MDDWKKANGVMPDPTNQRIKVMNAQSQELDREFIKRLQQMEKETGFSKTIVYAKKGDVDFFLEHGFQLEGKIDGFFAGQNAYLMAKFQNEERTKSPLKEEQDQIVELALKSQGTAMLKPLPDGFALRRATEEDAGPLSELFKLVFKSYPTPVHDPDYVRNVMNGDTHFMVIEQEGRIISVASAEVTPRLKSAEMTDCATNPEFRGLGLLSHIFFALEDWMQERGIYYLFSLTRAKSPGMNITTAKHGYQYRGRLINNCDIYSGFEDMNIWVKPLKPTWD